MLLFNFFEIAKFVESEEAGTIGTPGVGGVGLHQDFSNLSEIVVVQVDGKAEVV